MSDRESAPVPAEGGERSAALAPSASPPPREVLGPAVLRRNRAAILGFEFLWGVGLPFVQSTTTLPGYLQALGASGLMIGLVPAVFAGGIALVQPLSLYLIRPGPGRFRKMIWAYRTGALFYLVMAASALLLPPAATAARLGVFFACYAAYVLVAGAGDPHYIAMIVASVSPKERGRFFGMRIVWFGMGGLLGGVFAGPALRALEAPRNFGLSIAVGATLILVATVWFGRFRDDARAEETPRPSLAACLTDVWHLAGRERRFLFFLMAAALFVLAQGPFTFLALYIKERLQAGDAILGRLSAVFAVCSMIFALAIGHAGDRFGHRCTFQWGLVLYAAGLLMALAATSLPGLLAAYFVASTFSPVWQIAAFNLAFECSGEVDAARVYAGLSLVSAPLRIIGPLGAGVAVDRWGYAPVFLGTALLAGVGWALSFLLPREPRRKEVHSS